MISISHLMFKKDRQQPISDIDGLMSAYAAGTLTPAQTLVMDCYNALNGTVRAECRHYAAIGGAALDQSDIKSSVSDSCLARLMNRIDHIEDEPVPAAPLVCRILPRPLTAYTECHSHEIIWSDFAPGISYSHVNVPLIKQERAFLMKMEAGVSVPEHSHKGLELMLVLDGAFYDENGSYERGDLSVEADGEHHAHTPTADSKQGCICLAVIAAPLKFTRLKGMLMNIFMRF